jgi:hypothetical protein
MQFELKFYIGTGKDEVRYVGNLPLSNEHTYKHYLGFSKIKGAVYSIWFESIFPDKPHANALIDDAALIFPFEENNAKGLIYILPSTSYRFLTHAEWNNEEGVNSLISKLRLEDLSRFF